MSVQRRRGQLATVYRVKTITDARGNRVVVTDFDNPTQVRAAFIPQRSSRAEVPGQQAIDVVRMILDPDTPDVQLWNRVLWRGREWDVAAPPAYRHGTRQTRHLSVDLRARPTDGGAP